MSMQRAALVVTAAILTSLAPVAVAQENFERWELLQRNFPSTGGAGIMIGEYNPVIVGDRCRTDFTATEPGGKIYYNTVEFEALATAGGTLCHNGKWRAIDGSMSGTTPLRVFIQDGLARRSPD